MKLKHSKNEKKKIFILLGVKVFGHVLLLSFLSFLNIKYNFFSNK